MKDTGYLAIIFITGALFVYLMIGQSQKYELQMKALEAQVDKTYCKGEVIFRRKE